MHLLQWLQVGAIFLDSISDSGFYRKLQMNFTSVPFIMDGSGDIEN
jgi:hypothetical protein